MDYKELLQQIKEFLSACEQMRYGEYVGAPWPYNHDGPMVYTEPDAVLLGLASNAITDLLARAEAAEARVHELETMHRTEMCESGYDCVELGKARNSLKDAEDRLEKAEKMLHSELSYFSQCEALKKKLRYAERAIAALMQIEPQERITTCFGHPIGRVMELIEADKRREILIYPKKRERVPVILIQDEQSDLTQKQWEFLASRFLKVR